MIGRRKVLAGTAGIITGAGLLGEARASAADKPAIVFIHGAWHGAWTWSEVTPLLASAGYASIAFDLPGAGSRTLLPKSFLKRPLDAALFSTEVSPVAKITQEERTAAAVDVVRSAATLGNGKVVLVGHSWGGLTISHVAEAVPELLKSVVYLSAHLVPNGIPVGALLVDPALAASAVRPLLRADPAKVGAMRLDTRTEDPAERQALKQAFYGDVSDERFDAIANLLHPDEAASTAGFPMKISAGKYGTVDRHYIMMDADHAIPPPAQALMIKTLDDTKVGRPTIVHSMAGSHSPFFAKPAELSQVLRKIAS
jgi:pimeloyl-ACP methyl ester carboxylesterase